MTKNKYTYPLALIKEKKVNDENKKVVIFDIKDNGIGIDKEIIPKLFTKFASKSFQGPGLGLYISKNIIKAHDGRMCAENNKDNKDAILHQV
ncbi:MAG: ATP-binding protein [Candidatus Nitrosocosmicus sp.]